VIFNPAARGNKARHFRRHLDAIGGDSALKATAAAGDARRLAAEAVAEGFDVVAAAGGDGTVNEVLNGIGDANGFDRTRLAILPLGTVNVFARELRLPSRIEQAWAVVRRGKEMAIDLPHAEFMKDGVRKRFYFAQMGGAGLDARAIELVDFSVKKKIGPLAYVMAGLKALRERKPQIQVTVDGQTHSGELVLVGNGKYYGGTFRIFPQADWCDGLLEICVFPRTDWMTLLRVGPGLLLTGKVPSGQAHGLRATRFELSSGTPAAFELDGEWIGHLPATFAIERERLRLIVP